MAGCCGAEGGLLCRWPIDLSSCCSDVDLDEVPFHVIESAEDHASAMLTRLSGYTIGSCEAEIRPLQECRECRSRCCGGADAIRLSGPLGMSIETVHEVRTGDEVADPGLWRFDRESQRLLARPPMSWPRRDDRWEDCGGPGTFCVSATVGSAPDAWALSVASSLACELIKSCISHSKCRIPRRATQVTGQGITVSISDTDLRNLLPEVTGWVSAVNPHRAKLPARLYSPDAGPQRSEALRGRLGGWSR